MDIKKVLVTGSSGTIGTRLCEKLLENDYEVNGFDLEPNKWNKEVDKRTIIGDLRDEKGIVNMPKKTDLLIHLAANARVYNLVVNPRLAKDNFNTLFNTLEFARENKIPKFIFSSSREVYGCTSQIIHNEDEAHTKNCESPYTSTKIGGEALVHSYKKCYNLDSIILRFSNVYGMYDDKDRLIPHFINLTKQERDLTIYGENKLLDFTYIDDTVDGIMKAIQNFNEAKNEVFNISSGKGASIIRVAKLIQKTIGKYTNITFEESKTGEVERFIADITKAEKILNYKPEYSIETGIKKSVEWYERWSYQEKQ